MAELLIFPCHRADLRGITGLGNTASEGPTSCPNSGKEIKEAFIGSFYILRVISRAR